MPARLREYEDASRELRKSGGPSPPVLFHCQEPAAPCMLAKRFPYLLCIALIPYSMYDIASVCGGSHESQEDETGRPITRKTRRTRQAAHHQSSRMMGKFGVYGTHVFVNRGGPSSLATECISLCVGPRVTSHRARTVCRLIGIP